MTSISTSFAHLSWEVELVHPRRIGFEHLGQRGQEIATTGPGLTYQDDVLTRNDLDVLGSSEFATRTAEHALLFLA